ncbi:hypothetical protein [Deinococcus multiflagellatus]|uniref:Uncharacterized protein n=1 Tax=Deinococcus multiflagellatus TaxID=1656887 RepID=A0ABW1ZPR4_9DEIO|nr:hypothetical protein [Deinococcus multiflagellatus]MBZ9714696.1 hypothetical protein [Deinococcus multiflagellatus]
MTETLHVRWKPGTLDTLLVTSPHGTLEWNVLIFERVFGAPAVGQLYLQGRATVTREALPAAAQVA